MTNIIHPTALIEGDVQIGENNEILPYTVLRGPLRIGNGNLIGPHVVIGSPGADTRNPRYDSSNRRIEIGNNNIVREFSAIQKPCYRDITKIENNTFLMQGANVSHDVVIEEDVVITANSALAGIAHIMRGANLGMGCTIHQYAVIGPYSIVATNAAAIKNVRPFSRYIPGKPVSVNEYAIKKFGFLDYVDQIRRYVLEGVMPLDEKVLGLVERYERLSTESGRPQY